jgi:hypothetical protein
MTKVIDRDDVEPFEPVRRMTVNVMEKTSLGSANLFLLVAVRGHQLPRTVGHFVVSNTACFLLHVLRSSPEIRQIARWCLVATFGRDAGVAKTRGQEASW